MARSGAPVFQYPAMVNRKDTDGTIPRDGNTSRSPPRLTFSVQVGGGPSFSPTRKGSKNIGSPSGTIGPVEVSNAQPFHTSINVNSSKHGDPEPTFSKVICRKLSNNSRADVYSHCRMNFMCDAVLIKSPNFLNPGLSSVHTSDELGSFSIPDIRIRMHIDGSNWILPGHLIGEVTAARMSRTRSEQNYSSKTYFETRRENQYFGRQNNSMSRPPLYLTHFGKNTTNGTTSPIDLVSVGTKTPEPTLQTRPTDSPTLPTNLPEQNGKAHVPGDSDLDPSWSYSSSNKYNLSKDTNSSQSIKNKHNKKKKIQKHKKQDASD